MGYYNVAQERSSPDWKVATVIEVNSYLRNSRGDLVPLDEVSEPPADPGYIEGSLELIIDSVAIIDKAMWDYINELWAYVSNMVELLIAQGESETYFPDQPIKLSFRRQDKGWVLVTLAVPATPERRIRDIVIPASAGEKRVAIAQEDELIATLRENGVKFFRKMRALLPDGPDYDDALERLTKG